MQTFAVPLFFFVSELDNRLLYFSVSLSAKNNITHEKHENIHF